MARKKKNFFSIKKIITQLGPTGVGTQNFYIRLGDHLVPDAKVTFEQMDSKHIYKLFTVCIPIMNEDGWCGAKLKYMFQNFTFREVISKN